MFFSFLAFERDELPDIGKINIKRLIGIVSIALSFLSSSALPISMSPEALISFYFFLQIYGFAAASVDCKQIVISLCIKVQTHANKIVLQCFKAVYRIG